MKPKYVCSRGFSLIEMMLALALVVILASIIASVISSMRQQMKVMDQKSDLLDLKNQLLTVMQNPAICQCHLNPAYTIDNSNDAHLKFDSNITDKTQKIPVPKIFSGCTSASPTIISVGQKLPSGLEIEAIQLENLEPTGVTNEWQGQWAVSVKNGAGTKPFKDITISQRFALDPTSPSASRLIGDCVNQNSTNCSGLGGTVDTVTGKCDFYLGQMARASLVMDIAATSPVVHMLGGPKGAKSVQASGCPPGAKYLTSKTTCTTATGGQAAPTTNDKDVFVYRLNYTRPGTTRTFDSIHCNEQHGWQLSGCFTAVDGQDADVVYSANGCMTGDYRQGQSVEMTITCTKNMW